MRYLKRFNESLSEYDLKEFCEENLVSLMDNKYNVYVYNKRDNEDIYPVVIFLGNDDIEESFKWDDIKEDFIPFIELLKTKYTITNENGNLPAIIKFNKGYNSSDYHIDDILEDDISDLEYDRISFYIKDENKNR